MTDCDSRLTTLVCETMPFETLPDYDVYTAATWAIQDSIEQSL
jgi:hypothetical protein